MKTPAAPLTGDDLHAWRLARGLSLTAAERALGTCHKTLAAWEARGAAAVPPLAAAKVAAFDALEAVPVAGPGEAVQVPPVRAAAATPAGCLAVPAVPASPGELAAGGIQAGPFDAPAAGPCPDCDGEAARPADPAPCGPLAGVSLAPELRSCPVCGLPATTASLAGRSPADGPGCDACTPRRSTGSAPGEPAAGWRRDGAPVSAAALAALAVTARCEACCALAGPPAALPPWRLWVRLGDGGAVAAVLCGDCGTRAHRAGGNLARLI